MTIESAAPYVHRHNPDGSHDSICPLCFRTVSGSLYERELFVAESAHACADLVGHTWCDRLYNR
jgi:hypothetical protein